MRKIPYHKAKKNAVNPVRASSCSSRATEILVPAFFVCLMAEDYSADASAFGTCRRGMFLLPFHKKNGQSFLGSDRYELREVII